jgi:hypothetical protein
MTVRAPRPPVAAASQQNDYEVFVARLSRKGLASIERHMEICEADAALGYGKLWKHLAGFLGRLAPYAIEASGQQVVRFYIPDGKYRVQVFALHDARKGTLTVYLPDIAAAAVEKRLIKPVEDDGPVYTIVGDAHGRIELEPITPDTPDLPDFCKPMLGWGRRAVRTTLPAHAPEKQVRAVERLCELAAEAWPKIEPPAPLAPPAVVL